MSLCSSCQNFDLRSLSRTSCQWRCFPSKSVLAGARSGCLFCRLLVIVVGRKAREIMRSASASWVRIHFEPEAKGKEENGLGIRWLHTAVSSSAKPSSLIRPRGWRVLHVAADEGTPAAVSGDVRGRYVNEVSPFDGIELIKDWCSTCDTHTTCSRTLSGQAIDPDHTPLPKRCIRVTTSSANDADLNITLEETAGKYGRYICLSHRWVQPYTEISATTTSNYTARISGAHFGDLPHRFLEAFRTASGFGIQYVWIDSLCIIQDEAGDWEAESAMMGGYYQLATFTVISTLSNSSSYAEYSPPKPKLIARLPYRDDAGVRKGSFYVYPRRDPPSELSKKFTEHIGNSQILTRGWVFQEWLLSRRIICFTQSGVYMQCLCRNETVRNQLGEDIGFDFYHHLDVTAVLSIKSSLRLELDSAEDIYCGWEGVVEQYSRLAFSYPEKDRIMALLGVAREFAATLAQTPCHKGLQTTEDLFIAGLWTSDLERGLLWEQAVHGTHKRLANFPTWSWASISSVVRWRERHRRRHYLDMLPDESSLAQYWRRSWAKSELIFVACTAVASHRIPLLNSPADPHIGSLLETPCPGGEGGAMEPEFDVLHIRGRLQAVHIDYLPIKIPNSTTANVDVCNREDSDFSGRRIVATAGFRGFISGWASLEHPEFQNDSVFMEGEMIFALLVSSIPDASRLRLNFAEALSVGGQPIAEGSAGFNVLYLRRSQRAVDGFERLGMGRLFGYNAAKEFEMATERDVRLL